MLFFHVRFAFTPTFCLVTKRYQQASQFLAFSGPKAKNTKTKIFELPVGRPKFKKKVSIEKSPICEFLYFYRRLSVVYAP